MPVRPDLLPDNLAGNHQLHPAILLPAGGVVVRRHRTRLAESASAHSVHADALLHQVVVDGAGAFLGQAPYARGWGFNNFSSTYTVMNNDLTAVLTGGKTVAQMLADVAASLKG